MIVAKKIIPLAFLFFIAACNVNKKSTSSSKNTLPVITLDTITASANAPEPLAYQPSATRLTDIIHTKLEVSFDWTKRYMYGKATITAKPYFYPTATMVLDARGMEIKEVSLVKTETVTNTDVKQSTKGKIYEPSTTQVSTKKPQHYVYTNDSIKIDLDREYKNNEQYTVFIDYISKPYELKKNGGSEAITDDRGLYFINADGKEKDKPQQIWSQGETESNSVWFPTIDKPNERMTDEIYITVDKKYVTLSNGELVSSFENADNTRTDYWKMDLPHAPYLVMMAIGEFAIVKDTWRDKEVNYYVEKEYEPYAKAIFGKTPEMMEFFSNKLGVPFAWNKYSQIVVRDYVSGSMENTSATLHGEFLQHTDRELIDKSYEEYISHELFHQWFGDLVTTESWSNTPLNESFATYGEYLWNEYKYGREEADAKSAESRNGYFREAARKQVCLVRFQYSDKEDMFDAHSYNKGGQVLHMLRKYVGDDAFFASLKLYLETNKFSSVEIHNLRLAFEQVTGEDLNWFFNQWFLSPGHPELVIKSDYDEAAKKEKVTITQVQKLGKTPTFNLPIYIDIYADGKTERKKIRVTKTEETFSFDVATKPDLVNVDAEKQLLCIKTENKSIAEWVFQYNHAPLYLDRYEALSELHKKAMDSTATAIIIKALSDKYYGLREDAIAMLKDVKAGNDKEIKEKLITLAKTDEKSSVRADAIDYLSAKYKDKELEQLYINALKEKSYYVLGSALSAIAKANPQEGVKLAKPFESEKNSDILIALTDLYATAGTDENNDFYIKSSKVIKGFSLIGFINNYGTFLKTNKKNETVNSGIEILANIAKEENALKWVSFIAKKTINDIQLSYEDRANKATDKLKELKASSPNSPEIMSLQTEIENLTAEKQKINDVYISIK